MPSGPLTKQPSRRQTPAGGRPMGVSVVIVTYRNEADIGACLSAVSQAAPGTGMEVIVVDNASGDAFDETQVLWLEHTLQLDASNPQIQTVVVGMHEALPDSISSNHAMDESEDGLISGQRVYRDLLAVQNNAKKHVYVLASHSHYYMEEIFDTAYWRANGGVLPGWIVGTAGAYRYALPPNKTEATVAETNVYGYLLGTVKPGGEINFQFRKLEESDVPASVVSEYKQEFVHWCFEKNSALRSIP